MPERLRRLRQNPALRQMLRETRLSASDLIYPMFVKEGLTGREPIPSMPGQWRHSVDSAVDLAGEAHETGVRSVLLFGLPSSKDELASSSRDRNGIVQQAIRAIKAAHPELVVITDVCVCAYTPHGHCGVIREGRVDNDETLPLLSAMALSHAEAGADIVAPSSMMDGQVGALRGSLDISGFEHLPVMGYSMKFSGSFYGPFRDAADSAPSFGDRASYQHDFANPRHAERELLDDVAEGADIVMVKPGLAYLDMIYRARQLTNLPLAVYSVSGEYSMIKAAAANGWLDERGIVIETLTAFKRAGADLIITYFALEAASWINSQS